MAKGSAVKGNAQHWKPRFVPLGIVVTTPDHARSSSRVPRTKKVAGQLPLILILIWHGAPAMGAECGSIRSVVTTQTASSGKEEKKLVNGSTISLVLNNECMTGCYA